MVKCKDIIVLTCGDKLKAIRKKYNLKQEEIAGKDITRNLISEIETNKASLTKKTAEIVMDNLNKIAKKEKFEVTETVDYLIEGELSQANKVLDKYINELKTLIVYKDNSFIEKLKEAEEFLINWDIKDKKITIYELAGDYFCNNNEIYKSVIYYEKAKTLVGKIVLSDTLLALLRKLSMAYGYLGKYKDSIECCEFALNNFFDMPIKTIITFRYNNALNYSNLKKYKIAMDNLKIAEKLVSQSDINSYFLIQNNIGACLYKMKEFNEAKEVFVNLKCFLKSNQEKDKHAITLVNITNAYLALGSQVEANKNFNDLLDEIPNISNSSYEADIYFEVAQIYGKLEKISLSETYYLKSLNFAENEKNYILSSKILYDLIDIYSNSNNIEKMEYIKNKVFTVIHLRSNLSNELIYKLIIFYTEHNKDTAKSIANFALDFQKEGEIC